MSHSGHTRFDSFQSRNGQHDVDEADFEFRRLAAGAGARIVGIGFDPKGNQLPRYAEFPPSLTYRPDYLVAWRNRIVIDQVKAPRELKEEEFDAMQRLYHHYDMSRTPLVYSATLYQPSWGMTFSLLASRWDGLPRGIYPEPTRYGKKKFTRYTDSIRDSGILGLPEEDLTEWLHDLINAPRVDAPPPGSSDLTPAQVAFMSAMEGKFECFRFGPNSNMQLDLEPFRGLIDPLWAACPHLVVIRPWAPELTYVFKEPPSKDESLLHRRFAEAHETKVHIYLCRPGQEPSLYETVAPSAPVSAAKVLQKTAVAVPLGV